MDSVQAFQLAGIDAVGQAALVSAGEITAVELLDAAIIRLEAARHLNAVIADLFDRGRAQAADLDSQGRARAGQSGPLAGVPFLLKDLGQSQAGVPERLLEMLGEAGFVQVERTPLGGGVAQLLLGTRR